MASNARPAEPEAGFERTELPGGLRVLTERMPGVRSASTSALVSLEERSMSTRTSTARGRSRSRVLA